MDTVSSGWWILILLVLGVFHATVGSVPPLLAGVVCGYLMPCLTVRRGMFVGVWVAVPAVLLTVVGAYVPGPGFNLLAGPLTAASSMAVTVGLCWRQNRKRQTLSFTDEGVS